MWQCRSVACSVHVNEFQEVFYCFKFALVFVSGFTFIPIHDFVPQLQQNTFANGKALEGGGKFLDKYGPEHYINLAAASGNNYDGQGDNINYIPKK